MTALNRKVAEQRMFEDAKISILASGEFWPVSDLAKLLRVDRHTLDQHLIALRDCGKIFSIPAGTGGELYPRFAFNQTRDLEVFQAIPLILQIFGAKLSRWFIADCSYLDDQSPKDLIEEDPDWVIAPARDEMDDISHG